VCGSGGEVPTIVLYPVGRVHTRVKCGVNGCRCCLLLYHRSIDAYTCVACDVVRRVGFAKMIERYQFFGKSLSFVQRASLMRGLSGVTPSIN